jgi:hypothetical protein
MLKEDEEPIMITSAESLHRFPVSRTDPLLSEPIKNILEKWRYLNLYGSTNVRMNDN